MSRPSNVYVELPCVAHGGNGDAAGCRACLDALPPGEVAEDELTGGQLADALHTAVRERLGPTATQYLSIGDVTFRKSPRGVYATFSWKEGKTLHMVTVRMSAAKARSISSRLSKVVE